MGPCLIFKKINLVPPFVFLKEKAWEGKQSVARCIWLHALYDRVWCFLWVTARWSARHLPPISSMIHIIGILGGGLRAISISICFWYWLGIGSINIWCDGVIGNVSFLKDGRIFFGPGFPPFLALVFSHVKRPTSISRDPYLQHAACMVSLHSIYLDLSLTCKFKFSFQYNNAFVNQDKSSCSWGI